jgi:hypothetical protein
LYHFLILKYVPENGNEVLREDHSAVKNKLRFLLIFQKAQKIINPIFREKNTPPLRQKFHPLSFPQKYKMVARMIWLGGVAAAHP